MTGMIHYIVKSSQCEGDTDLNDMHLRLSQDKYIHNSQEIRYKLTT
jgi:hypothetical protein